MKRSDINAAITRTIELLHSHYMRLPPFAYWTPGEWKSKGDECAEIRDCMLGWDVTDFGTGDFEKVGLTVFTVRNGHKLIEAHQHKTYCEKILIVDQNQVTPFHYHIDKEEDIINAFGGELVVKLGNRGEDDGLADSDVTVSLDGVLNTYPAGAEVTLKPGESITLPPFLYHEFWAKEGSGTAVLREVSKVNDDTSDNFFLAKMPRYPDIEEDEEPVHLLCTEYEAAK